jgi:hypothetical protein
MNAQPKTDVIKVIYNEGEEKPWALDYEDVSAIKTARAALNYPAQKFETEEKAVEVAEMLRDIIKADAVVIPSEDEVLDDVEKAKFFQPISSEDKTNELHDGHKDGHDHDHDDTKREDVDFYATDEVDEDLIRESQQEADIKNLDSDEITTNPGESQRQAEREMGIDTPYTEADKAQGRARPVITPPPTI